MKENLKKYSLKIISIFLSLLLIQCTVFNVQGYTAAINLYSVEDVINNVSQQLLKKNDSAKDPWTVIGLARSGTEVPKEYFRKYYENLESLLKENNGILNERKYSEYSSAVIALTAIGKDPSNIAGYNLLEKLADFNKVVYQGINGAVWALIALDSGEYTVSIVEGIENLTSRDRLIDFILSRELEAGGWSMGESTPDPDVTAMVLQSLSKYQSIEEVKTATDRAMGVLSNIQKESGGYESWKIENSESGSQVLVALCSLGIDPETDDRFIKNKGNWVVSNLINDFYIQSAGGFMHIKNTNVNVLATNQGFYALVAYERFTSGKTSLYDMSDVLNNNVNNSDSVFGLNQGFTRAQFMTLVYSTLRITRSDVAGMLYLLTERFN